MLNFFSNIDIRPLNKGFKYKNNYMMFPICCSDIFYDFVDFFLFYDFSDIEVKNVDEDVIIATGKDLKVGKYVVIDNIPCRVVEIEVSKPGKHGAAKMRVTGIGIFGGEKKVLLIPADAEVKVPIIKKRTGQVLSVLGETVQVMDKDTYETFEVPLSQDLKEVISEGKEIEIIETMGMRQIARAFKE